MIPLTPVYPKRPHTSRIIRIVPAEQLHRARRPRPDTSDEHFHAFMLIFLICCVLVFFWYDLAPYVKSHETMRYFFLFTGGSIWSIALMVCFFLSVPQEDRLNCLKAVIYMICLSPFVVLANDYTSRCISEKRTGWLADVTFRDLVKKLSTVLNEEVVKWVLFYSICRLKTFLSNSTGYWSKHLRLNTQNVQSYTLVAVAIGLGFGLVEDILYSKKHCYKTIQTELNGKPDFTNNPVINGFFRVLIPLHLTFMLTGALILSYGISQFYRFMAFGSAVVVHYANNVIRVYLGPTGNQVWTLSLGFWMVYLVYLCLLRFFPDDDEDHDDSASTSDNKNNGHITLAV